MSSFLTVTLLLAAVTLPYIVSSNHEEDFAFDVSDDLEVELEDGQLGKWSNREFVANVGRIFHLVIPKDALGGKIESFEVKRHNGKGIPSWLLFHRKGGIFWGIPLKEDIGTVHLTVRSTGDKSVEEELKIEVVQSDHDSSTMGKCLPNEDNTILTLLLDKNIRAIKPKQRVVAVNNVAKFFGLPYSAFTLKPQQEKDDITDSSVVLAGPGNLRTRTSKLTSLLQVPVGCDGHLWPSTATLVHQLKQQARDGTIAEVLRLPLIGWRVKTESKPVLRPKRQAITSVDDYGSGDYDDEDDYYYDEDYDGKDDEPQQGIPTSPKLPASAPVKKSSTTTSTTTPAPKIESSGDYEGEDDDYEYEDIGDDLDPIEGVPPSPKATATLSTTTVSTTTASTVHPHRHHHGEVNPSVAVAREHHQTTHRVPVTEEIIPVTTSTTTTTTTTTERITEPSTTSTTTTTTTTTPATTTVVSEQPKIDLNKSKQVEYPDYNYDDNYDDEDNEEEPIESQTIVPVFGKKQTAGSRFGETETVTTEGSTTKGTTSEDVVVENIPVTVSVQLNATVVSTTSTTTTTEQSTTPQIIIETEPEVVYTTETEVPQSTFPVTVLQQTTQTSTVGTTTVSVSSTSSTTAEPTTVEEETIAEKVTTTRQVSTTVKPVTIPESTEGIEHHENFKPFIENRLKQMSVIAGKIFRFVIPHNTFKDFEDEYDLTYELLDSNNRTVTNNTWLKFNAPRREIYGLPLEEDVSKWVFWVKATDSEGESEKEKLNIQVQQHKLDLVVNHEFTLQIRIEKHLEFPHYVDWSLKVLRALGKIYNTNMSEITVRHINHTSVPVNFTWSNDSIATNYCPKTEIAQLYKTLTANDEGDPSRELNVALAPELRVKKVLYREIGVCEQPQTPVAPPVHPVTPVNFSPILRNPVDHVNATVGELLVYKVKDDTFYDPEDVDPRMLNISLLTSDRQPIPPNNWLQFDSKNREFFGIPKQVGRSEYHLVCVDSGGLPATDSLEVVVYPAPKRKYNVEFVMNITEIDFTNNAALQKRFVEKLMRLFGDTSSSNIHIDSFNQSYNSTIVTWFNKSLTTEMCPHDEINRLESILRNMNDKSISHRVHNVMEPDFRVSTIKVHLIHNCQPKIAREPRPEIVDRPIEETTPASSSDEYLITFIVPAVIIAIMLFLAAVAACVLYRRRRTGKMNVEEDGRQSYGNKGIPVIFQEELEEKPEPGTKAPVILKDEKPPLAPPEYSKSGSVKLSDDSEPYQPPPPFTRTQDKPRPKPTPTYRKPPPYVPP